MLFRIVWTVGLWGCVPLFLAVTESFGGHFCRLICPHLSYIPRICAWKYTRASEHTAELPFWKVLPLIPLAVQACVGDRLFHLDFPRSQALLTLGCTSEPHGEL